MRKRFPKFVVLLSCTVIFILTLTSSSRPDVAERNTISNNFVFAVLPDTQLYSQLRPYIFESQTRWIVDNAETERINFTLHLGDIVNKSFDVAQWEAASKAMSILENADMCYAAVTGNHDVDFARGGVEDDFYYDDMRRVELENFPKYFPVSRFANMETFGGASDNGFNTYHFVKCGETKIMVLALDWLPSDSTMKWAEKLLKENRHTPTMIVKHNFIKPRKNLAGNNGKVKFSNDETKKQWEILKKYDNVFFIINGHHSGSDYGVLQNNYGNDVFLTSVDFQNKTKGGNGWMRIIEFDFEKNCIKGKTLSPYVMSIPDAERGENDLVYLDDEMNSFSFPFDLTTRFRKL